jgi:hypothetical protein
MVRTIMDPEGILRDGAGGVEGGGVEEEVVATEKVGRFSIGVALRLVGPWRTGKATGGGLVLHEGGRRVEDSAGTGAEQIAILR